MRKIFYPLFIAFFLYESYFSINTLFLNPPDYGAAKLDSYFENILDKSRPIAAPHHPNLYLDKIIKKYPDVINITFFDSFSHSKFYNLEKVFINNKGNVNHLNEIGNNIVLLLMEM